MRHLQLIEDAAHGEALFPFEGDGDSVVETITAHIAESLGSGSGYPRGALQC